MTDIAQPTRPAADRSEPAAPARRRPTRSEGQWALGYREPLNSNEQAKKDDNGLNVRHRIETIYAQGGFGSIDPADLRGRFRWMGLYTQRREGIDGGRTAALEPEELEDEFLMMRVRTDGGALTTEQVRILGQISVDFARDTADITDRQNIQYHWIDVRDVPEIWRRLESVGLSTTEACGDTPRGMLGSPVAGVSKDEIVDASPALAQLRQTYIGDPELANLPRKFKTTISWLPDTAPEVDDVAFVGVVHPELGPGFDLMVGGGLSTNPMLAQRLGVWVRLADIPDVWHGVIRIFRDYGYRRLRSRARLKFLVADWGPAKFREVLETEYLHYRLPDGPPAPVADETIDHIGVHQQVDGRYYVGFAPVAGRVSGKRLLGLADAAERVGSTRIRVTPLQKVLVLDVPEAKVEDLIAELAQHDLPARPSPWRRATMACTGIEFCKLAIVDTKARAARLIDELEERLAELQLDRPIAIHLNGCPNSCARVQVADIGLKGQIVTDAQGNQVEGFQVHLGGGLGIDAGFGRKLRGHKVTSAELGDYVERVVRGFQRDREPDERFAQWVHRTDEANLR